MVTEGRGQMGVSVYPRDKAWVAEIKTILKNYYSKTTLCHCSQKLDFLLDTQYTIRQRKLSIIIIIIAIIFKNIFIPPESYLHQQEVPLYQQTLYPLSLSSHYSSQLEKREDSHQKKNMYRNLQLGRKANLKPSLF